VCSLRLSTPRGERKKADCGEEASAHPRGLRPLRAARTSSADKGRSICTYPPSLHPLGGSVTANRDCDTLWETRDDDAPTAWDHFVASEAAIKGAAAKLLQAIEHGDAAAFREAAMQVSAVDDGWNYSLTLILEAKPQVSPTIRSEFLNEWAFSGRHVRSCAYSDALLVDALRLIFGDYQGPALRLFRGESLNNCRRRRTGVSWTTSRKVADIFASQWPESVMLETVAPRQAILGAVPSWTLKGLYAQEYVVDPRALGCVRIVQRYIKL
jgi:hypothetical protein